MVEFQPNDGGTLKFEFEKVLGKDGTYRSISNEMKTQIIKDVMNMEAVKNIGGTKNIYKIKVEVQTDFTMKLPDRFEYYAYYKNSRNQFDVVLLGKNY